MSSATQLAERFPQSILAQGGTGRFFTVSDIAAELVNELRQYGFVTLRADYNLDDETFLEIALDVMYMLGDSSLYGVHWLVIIWLSLFG